MKNLSILMLGVLLLGACGAATTEEAATETSGNAVENTVEVAPEDAMASDLQEARDVWARVLEMGPEANLNDAVVQMKMAHGMMYMHAFNGDAPQEVVDFAEELKGLLNAGEAEEFDMEFFHGALTEGLAEYDALLESL